MSPPLSNPNWPSWFEPFTRQCSKPRPTCGPTATFLGQCFHIQVINYLQWGVMNKLCDQMRQAFAMHSRRDTVITSLWYRTGFTSAHFHQQTLMTELGGEYVDALEAAPDPPSDLDKRVMRRRLGRAMAAEIQKFPIPWSQRPETACATTCRMTRTERRRFDEQPWGYIWWPNR